MKNKLAILYYHEVVEAGSGYSYQRIEINKFEEQMKFLSDNGYTSIKFSDLEQGHLPPKAVIVSVDDGYRSVYDNAAPVMKKYGIKGNVYLATAYIQPETNYLDWNMVRELKEQWDFDFQAHTHNHIDIRTADKSQLKKEVELSDQLFQKYLGYLPMAFCMPYGRYDRRAFRELKSLERYKIYLASHTGRISKNALITGKALPRIGISNDDSLKKFKHKIEGKYYLKGRLQLARLMLNNAIAERIIEKEM